MTKPVVAFDQHGPEYAADWKGILAGLRANSPVAWTEAHGGFWIVTRYDDIVHCERTPQIFSCDNDLDGTRNGGQGIRIPRNPFRFNLNESDPPEHTALRKLEQPFFPVQALQQWMDYAARLADEHIDAFIGKGACDLIEELTIPVPAKVTLTLVGIPADDWRDYMSATLNAFLPTDHPDYPLAQRMRIGQRIAELMEERQRDPRDDIISALVNAEINGERLPFDVAKGMVQSLCFGGFDTTAATSANAIRWLEDKPEIRERMIADPDFLSKAVDELLRYFSPVVGGLSRTVVEDTELRGQTLRKGERVLLMYNSGNYDEERFPDPDTCDLARPNAKQHLAFGAGPHRCIGAVLGHAEVCRIVRAFISRVPDYRIDHDREKRFPSMGLANGWLSMPVSFTPQAARTRTPVAA
ncbi:MAG: cytochrome P450 [Novosphingobium sp.]|nr:cytochrome P450 [Novosphingobium sp.]